jgi:2-methylisocitrate lyase-like PEP mutase family enzyme
MVAKVKAAVDARVDEDLVIMARTDAIAVYGIEDAIERANLYREAGADLLFVEAPRSVAEMKRINQSVDAPTLAIQIEGGKTPLLTTQELQEIGFNVVVYPNATVYATAWALKGLWETLKKEGTTRRFTDRMICFDDFNTLVGLDKIRELESFYYRDLFESLQKQNK